MCWHCYSSSSAAFTRRSFVALAGASASAAALAQVEVGKPSSVRGLVAAEELENAASQEYAQMMAQARAQKALAPADHPGEHLRALAKVSRALRQADLREQLRQARSPDAIRALLVRDARPTAA